IANGWACALSDGEDIRRRGCADADFDLRCAAQWSSQHEGIALAHDRAGTDRGGVTQVGGFAVWAGKEPQSRVVAAGCVVEERLFADGCVCRSRGVEVKRLDADGGVVASRGVVGQCTSTG